jgi:hypothetical protein
MKLVFRIICLFLVVESSAQNLIFNQPLRLSSAVNSESEEINPILSPDGKTLYFVRAFHDDNNGGDIGGTDIWSSTKVGGAWQPASNRIGKWNNLENNAIIGLNKKELIAYLANTYKKQSGVAFSKLVNGQWSLPELIPVPGLNRGEFIGFYMSPAFDVLLISMHASDSYGEEDLYISVKDTNGNWPEPRNLGPTINTSGFEISPFLSGDGEKIFFASNSHQGLGDADIFYSYKLYNSWETWSTPINVGEPVNSASFDAYFTSSGDTLAYFCSNRGGKLSDIYETKISVSTSILPEGARYLTQEEVRELFPQELNRILVFDKGEAKVHSGQRELLWFIANSILIRENIRIHLFVREEENPALTPSQVADVAQLLTSAGIDDTRVLQANAPVISRASQHGTVIELLFFK